HHVFLEHPENNRRVAGGSNRAVLDRVGELIHVRGVVPQACRRGLRHAVKWALVSSPRRVIRHLREHLTILIHIVFLGGSAPEPAASHPGEVSTTTARSAIAREDEAELLAQARVRPTNGDHLLLREEANAVLPAHLRAPKGEPAGAP